MPPEIVDGGRAWGANMRIFAGGLTGTAFVALIALAGASVNVQPAQAGELIGAVASTAGAAVGAVSGVIGGAAGGNAGGRGNLAARGGGATAPSLTAFLTGNNDDGAPIGNGGLGFTGGRNEQPGSGFEFQARADGGLGYNVMVTKKVLTW